MSITASAEIEKTNSASSSGPVTQKMDVDERSLLICTMQLRQVEKRLEEFFENAQERIEIISQLQKLKQMILALSDSEKVEDHPELQDLLALARKEGLTWNKEKWSDKEDKHTLLDDIHSVITKHESQNQTYFMQINRLMSMRTERSNLFSRLAKETHEQKMRILQKLHVRA